MSIVDLRKFLVTSGHYRRGEKENDMVGRLAVKALNAEIRELDNKIAPLEKSREKLKQALALLIAPVEIKAKPNNRQAYFKAYYKRQKEKQAKRRNK
jgi:hypothetical protein